MLQFPSPTAIANAWKIGAHHFASRFCLRRPMTALESPINCRTTRAIRRSTADRATKAFLSGLWTLLDGFAADLPGRLRNFARGEDCLQFLASLVHSLLHPAPLSTH